MNALTPINYATNLPDWLRDPNFFAQTDKVAAGIGGGQPAYISIKAGKFRLVDESGQEEMVSTHTLDVVIFDASEHVSKIYYSGAYDPAGGNLVPPTCFADNGIAPSARSTEPQHERCASCRHNAWGSKITPTGSKIKACADAKKLAVVLAGDVQTSVNGVLGTAKAGAKVYLLRVPAASMRGVADVSRQVKSAGVPLIGARIRVGFDGDASYPSLTFQPVGYADRPVFERAKSLVNSPEARFAVGADDVPINFVASGEGAVRPENSLRNQVGNDPSSASSPTAPFAAAPASPTPPAGSTTTPAAAPAAEQADPPKRRRGRPPTEPAEPQPQQAASPPLPPATPFQTNGAIQQPQASNAQVDAMLAGVFGTPPT